MSLSDLEKGAKASRGLSATAEFLVMCIWLRVTVIDYALQSYRDVSAHKLTHKEYTDVTGYVKQVSSGRVELKLTDHFTFIMDEEIAKEIQRQQPSGEVIKTTG